MTYLATKFEVAFSNGLGEDAFTRNVTDGQRDRRQTDFGTKSINPSFFSKEKQLIAIMTKKMLIVMFSKKCNINRIKIK